MNNSNNILNELKEISPLLAEMEKINVFTVPEAYFDMLGENILMNVKEEEGSLLSSITSQPSLHIPTGYFESLADNILNKIKAQDDVIAEIKELSPLLYNIQNKNPYTVPQGYFENLAEVIKLKADSSAELNELSPLQGNLKNTNVFTVPAGYFQNLPGEILNKISPQQAKVVVMSRRKTSILKYAIAAAFTGVMALGLYQFTGNKNKLDVAVVEGIQIAKENRFEEELNKVSEDDIIKYLQDNGSDIDAALVANTIDENELPSQDDYLMDDKTLDNYLDNIDLNDLKN